MKINEEKLKEFLKRDIAVNTRNREMYASNHNYQEALVMDAAINFAEYLLTAWDDPDEFDFMEEE